MSTKLYLIISAALIAAFMAAIYVAINSATQSPAQPITSLTQSIDQTCVSNNTKMATHPITEKQPIKNNENTSNVLTILNLWHTLDNPAEPMNVRIDPRIKGAKKIAISSRILSSLSNNDIIQLPAIDDKKYLMHIKNITSKKDKTMEIYGEVDHAGAIYSSTITLTGDSLFALLTTPTGSYDIRMDQNKGYIYKSGQLDNTGEMESADSITDLPGFLN